MKMEQPIKAHKAGAIIGLVAEVGQTVTKCSTRVALGVEHAKFVSRHKCLVVP